MKKIVIPLLIAAMTCSFVSCGKDKEYEKYGDKQEIRATVYWGEFGYQWLKDLANEWNEKTDSNYYIKVTGDSYLATQIISHVKSGSTYDLYVCSDSGFQTIFNSGLLEDLSDLLPQSPDGNGVTVADMIPSYDTWRGLAGGEEKMYLLPYAISPTGLIFDYQKFYDNGWLMTDSDGSVSAGKDGIKGTYDDGQPTTWAEFDSLLRKINMTTNEVFCYMGATNPEYINNVAYAYLAQYLGEENYKAFLSHDTNGKEVKMTDGSMRAFDITEGYLTTEMDGMKQMLSFVKNYFLNTSYVANKALTDTSYAVDASHMSFLSGDAAYIVEGNWWENGSRNLIESYKALGGYDYGEGDYRYLLLPAIEGQATPSNKSVYFSQSGGSLVVPYNKDREKIAAVKDFLLFLLQNDNLTKVTIDTGLIWNYKYDIDAESRTKLTKFMQNTMDLKNDPNVSIHSFFLDCASTPIYAYSRLDSTALFRGKNTELCIPRMLRDSSVDKAYEEINTHMSEKWSGYLDTAKSYGFYK